MKTKDERRRAINLAVGRIEAQELLKQAEWSDAQLAMVETEELARSAYELSQPLQLDFRSIDSFLAYWRKLRRRSEALCG
ncbi:hypothetical protein [Nitrospira moscoviensis]|uniref:Uncharacterized protein n=1 Tax=Nitrospira moscoviensis TaxID=42253 RepID=A0A0K2GGV7_NITMO|nr:hypothetical protein [Nitrospira moscoviensis]ALA60198.1 hypothetical protein NITMOv2_3808 [Nitrospira moscoviensis]